MKAVKSDMCGSSLYRMQSIIEDGCDDIINVFSPGCNSSSKDVAHVLDGRSELKTAASE